MGRRQPDHVLQAEIPLYAQLCYYSTMESTKIFTDDELAKRTQVGKRILVNVILDRSGSMGVNRAETISGYNTYIQGLRADKETEYAVSLTQFDSPLTTPELTVCYLDKPLAEVPLLTEETYEPRGWTPLYDAIGETIRRVDPYQDGRPVLCVIITDGANNASREFNKTSIKKLITEKESKGWTFVYIGADIDVYAAADGLHSGNLSRMSNYTKGAENNMYVNMVRATATYASNRRAYSQDGGSFGMNSAPDESFFTDAQKASMGDTTTGGSKVGDCTCHTQSHTTRTNINPSCPVHGAPLSHVDTTSNSG